MPTQHFLLKSEPGTYSIADLERDRQTQWDGVRNHLAMRHLKEMKVGDEAFIYHSGDERQVVGLATVTGTARPDPTDATGKFVCVDLAFKRRLARPITLSEIKGADLKHFELVRNSRLSCMPVPDDVRAWIDAAEETK